MTRQGWTCARLMVVMALTVLAPLARAQDEAPAAPWGDDYFARQDLLRFLVDADAFLTSQPESPLGPQLAMEQLMAASIENKSEPFNAMRRKLLFEYPDSLQGKYLLSTFDADSYGTFLEQDLDLDVIADRKASELRVRGMEAAYARWGEDVFKDSKVAMRIAFLARRHEKTALAEVGQRLLAERTEKSAPVAALLFDQATDDLEKLAKLNDKDLDEDMAKLARELVLASLGDQERVMPEALEMALQEAMRDLDWVRVLSLADQLLAVAPDNCRARYWRCWALVGHNRIYDAQTEARAIVAEHPDDAWAAPAELLAKAIAPIEESIDRCVAAYQPAASVARRIYAVEMLMNARMVDDPAEVYVAIRPSGPYVEFSAKYEGAVLLAYRTDHEQSDFYLQSRNVTQRGKRPAELSVVILDWLMPAQLFFMKTVGEPLKYDEASLQTAFRKLLTAVDLSDRELCAKAILAGRQKGMLPLPPEVVFTATTLRILEPSIESPDVVARSVQLQADLEKVTVRYFTKTNRQLIEARFATTEDFSFSSPQWPEAPTVEVESLGGPDSIAAWAEFMSAVGRASAKKKTANRKTQSSETSRK
jgi:hypothetical protein